MQTSTARSAALPRPTTLQQTRRRLARRDRRGRRGSLRISDAHALRVLYLTGSDHARVQVDLEAALGVEGGACAFLMFTIAGNDFRDEYHHGPCAQWPKTRRAAWLIIHSPKTTDPVDALLGWNRLVRPTADPLRLAYEYATD